MKTTSYRLMASLLGLACGTACTAFGVGYGDEQAPAWRPSADATAKFLFNKPDAAPAGTNYWATGGTSAADVGTGQIQVNTGGAYDHWKGTFPWATNYSIQGVWNVNPSGTLVATIPGTPTVGAVKYVAVQTVEFKYPWFTPGDGVTNINFAFAQVAVGGGATQVGTYNEQTTGVQNGQGQPWVNRQTVWKLPAAGASETVTVTPQNNGSAFDSVIVDTLIVPNIACPAPVGPVPGPAEGIVVNYSAPTPGVGGAVASQTCVPASGSVFPQGETTVNCTNVDLYGGESTCSFTVTVVPAGSTVRGTVALDTFYGFHRLMTFVATDENFVELMRWTDVDIDFGGSGMVSFEFTGVPTGTRWLACKAVHHLSQRLAADCSSPVVENVDFFLKGGDGNNDNVVENADLDFIFGAWFAEGPSYDGDYNGDEVVENGDLDVVFGNWFAEGDWDIYVF